MKFPDDSPATITLAYKSGQTHIHEVDVATARSKAKTAIRRKSVKWIRVSIPYQDLPREARFFFSPATQTREAKWEHSIVLLPRTKD